MTKNILLIGGTFEGNQLAKILEQENFKFIISFFGELKNLNVTVSRYRKGGFGGIQKMSEWLKQYKITHVIDSSHPFAEKISYNAYVACRYNKIPIVRFTRKPWVQKIKDNWINVTDYKEAFECIANINPENKNIFLAIGKKNISYFYDLKKKFFLIRTVEKINFIPQFKNYHCIISKGPFNTDDDILLIKKFKIDLIISKNSGGSGAYSKIEAARILKIPVVMIKRPVLPETFEFYDYNEIISWLSL